MTRDNNKESNDYGSKCLKVPVITKLLPLFVTVIALLLPVLLLLCGSAARNRGKRMIVTKALDQVFSPPQRVSRVVISPLKPHNLLWELRYTVV